MVVIEEQASLSSWSRAPSLKDSAQPFCIGFAGARYSSDESGQKWC
jgi:hypothetical protein